jgi:dTDP-4-dehydrorhamnose 3,5-epimerase
MFSEGSIKDVIKRPLKKYEDDRGWLVELFREDELDPEIVPVMSYISETLPGVARGPHEHVDQTDYFAFIGPSTFKLYLWDNRKGSPTYKNKMAFTAGVDEPMVVVIPPGVVHAYKNIGQDNGIVYNAPNRLFAGRSRKEPVDEIRHEDDPDSPYQLA